MKDACEIEEVILQENGIIRNKDGKIIGRLVEDINGFAEKHYQRGYVDGLRKAQANCNGFCGEYECKENTKGCKRNDIKSLHSCPYRDRLLASRNTTGS